MRLNPCFAPLLIMAAVSFCTGCATNFSAVVRCTPAQPWDSRTPDQLYADINRLSPIEIPAGDIVFNRGMDGPSCWVCLGDENQSRMFVRALRKDPNWKVSNVSRLRTDARPLFGFASDAGSMLDGRTASELRTQPVAQAAPN